MPLFRPHRRTLEEALKESTIVIDSCHLCRLIEKEIENWCDIPIIPEYLDIQNYVFDPRTGWHTQIINLKKDSGLPPLGVLGFLSEPMPTIKVINVTQDKHIDWSKFKLIPNEVIPFLEEPDLGDCELTGRIADFEKGSCYTGSFKTRMMCYEIDKRMEYNKWLQGLPFIHWPAHYLIKVTPPFGAKVIRFRLRATDSLYELSVYLDGYNYSGCMPWPHYEIYGGHGDTSRCKWDDTEELLRLVHCHFYGFPKDESE